MALFQGTSATQIPMMHCPDCGGMVSRNADSCPHCGTRIKPLGVTVLKIVLWVVVISLGMFVASLLIGWIAGSLA
jgi:hypothetical protein